MMDSAQEIRNKHITKEEGLALIKNLMESSPLDMKKNSLITYQWKKMNLWSTSDKFRSPHLWHKVNGVWELRVKPWD